MYQPDNIIVSLMPISLLNAEGMPDWFLLQKEQRRGRIFHYFSNNFNIFILANN